jgi:hypothetical protein
MQGDHSEKRYHILGRKHTDDAGKRSAVKVACCVWRGAFGTGQQCTSLDAYPTEYVLVNTKRPSVEVQRRNEQGQWTIHNYTLEETIRLECLDISIPMKDLYEGISLEE